MKLKYFIYFLYLVLLSFITTPVLAIEPSCPDFPNFEPKSGPLADVNCFFHHQYEARIKQIITTLGAPGGRPVIIDLDGTYLILKYNGKTETIQIADSTYQNLKVFSHASLSILIILSQQQPGKIDESTLNSLQQLQTNLDAAIKIIPSLNLPPEGRQAVEKLSAITENYLHKLLTTKQWTMAELISYYGQAIGPINVMVKMAADVELTNLDRTLNQWLAPMSTEERNNIGIVIGVVHQARAEEHIIMYLSKRFSKHVGEGALYENGLVVAEGRSDEDSALALLARHYLDREIGRVVFNKVDRMQKDLMSDPGKQWIEQHLH